MESWLVAALQVAATVIPLLLYVERRITRLEVKVDLLWKLMNRENNHGR